MKITCHNCSIESELDGPVSFTSKNGNFVNDDGWIVAYEPTGFSFVSLHFCSIECKDTWRSYSLT